MTKNFKVTSFSEWNHTHLAVVFFVSSLLLLTQKWQISADTYVWLTVAAEAGETAPGGS